MFEDFRSALKALVVQPFNLDFPGIPLITDNEPFDYNNPPELYVSFEVHFQGGRQVGMTVSPKARRYGYVYVSVTSRVGTGTANSDRILSWFTRKLEFLSGGGIQLGAAELETPDTVKGWYLTDLKFRLQINP